MKVLFMCCGSVQHIHVAHAEKALKDKVQGDDGF